MEQYIYFGTDQQTYSLLLSVRQADDLGSLRTPFTRTEHGGKGGSRSVSGRRRMIFFYKSLTAGEGIDINSFLRKKLSHSVWV